MLESQMILAHKDYVSAHGQSPWGGIFSGDHFTPSRLY